MSDLISNDMHWTERDLLDRKEFVKKLLLVAEKLSNNKKNSCYAIDGSWGVGKSYVLDMFEEQARILPQEDTTLSKYIIFRYNCWEYDYYNEPLMAIVASMLDEIDTKIRLIPEDKKVVIIETLKTIGKGIFNRVIHVIDKATGLPVETAVNTMSEVFCVAKEKGEDVHSFDEYMTFKKTLKELQKTINLLTGDQTVVFIVDELDRCLPEYSIKVLERIHHLFDGVPNTQVILSVDKSQLSYAVRQIYGEDTNVDRYLAKFINFELKLNEGTISDQEKFDNEFKQYFCCFKSDCKSIKDSAEHDFIRMAFEGIDMRNRISILDKCLLLHSILCSDVEKMDFSVACIEILLAIIKYYKVDISDASTRFSISRLFSKSGLTIPKGLQLIEEEYKDLNKKDPIYYSEGSWNSIRVSDVWGVVLASYRAVIGFKNDDFLYNRYKMIDINNYAKDFWNLLQVIC